MSIIEKLTEGVIHRNVQKEGQALLDKWDNTGLLEGISSDHGRNSMAMLLENQAKELLREAASQMQTGDVEGFAAVAFPIVRRVFGGLVANDLVSVQPMSLPSGLVFFLDFTVATTRLGYESGESVYGGGAVGSQITGGVSLSGDSAEDSYYALNNGYSSPTGSKTDIAPTVFASGTFGNSNTTAATSVLPAGEVSLGEDANRAFDALLRYDADLVSGTTTAVIYKVQVSDLDQLNKDNLITITREGSGSAAEISGSQIRRLTQYSGSNRGMYQAGDPKNHVLVVQASVDGTVSQANIAGGVSVGSSAGNMTFTWAQFDDFTTADSTGGIKGALDWGLENEAEIPEINIKVDSVSITAQTKKLKAKWTPELQQDINAYHNLDAEVELTSILSEQIALEIDQEILNDLIKGATAGKYYWSRKPGKFVNLENGKPINETLFPDFTGTVSEWYETLIETMNDISAAIHRKTLRGGANFVVCGPEVANILEFTAGFRADTTADENRGTIGAVRVGQLSKKLDVYVDPYFPRNVCLVGRKGNSFLESGYVYAPYVPLQVTPTIFGPEDFVPRKGVMTRYAKKMVRPDMYGLVICQDLLG
jgi:hypothetical protein